MEPNKLEVWIKAVINWLLVLLPTGQEETSFFMLLTIWDDYMMNIHKKTFDGFISQIHTGKTEFVDLQILESLSFTTFMESWTFLTASQACRERSRFLIGIGNFITISLHFISIIFTKLIWKSVRTKAKAFFSGTLFYLKNKNGISRTRRSSSKNLTSSCSRFQWKRHWLVTENSDQVKSLSIEICQDRWKGRQTWKLSHKAECKVWVFVVVYKAT